MGKIGKNGKRIIPVLILLVIIPPMVWIGLKKTTLQNLSRTESVKVFVSILPQKYFVERIGGGQVAVSVMVGPGQNPVSYEPLPKQMVALTEADLYFRIGVPFETAWIGRIKELNPGLNIVDTRDGIKLRTIEGAHHHEQSGEGNGHGPGSVEEHETKDPHIWLDPILVKTQAQTIYRALAAFDPENQHFYEENLREFQTELDQLDRELTETFKVAKIEKIMVFHPAWGYLTDRYGLEQIPIEVEGKEPGPRELAQVIERAKQEGIQVIFVQSQYNTTAAESVARAVNGQVLTLDPLAEDYLANLRKIAQTMTREF